MESRTKKRASGMKLSLTEMLLALIVDSANVLIWQNTKDGAKGRNRPKSIFKMLTEEKKKDDYQVFRSSEDFDEWHRKRMKHG